MKAVRQILETRPNESFLAYRYAEADFYAPYHFHPEIELVMIEAGRGLRVVGDHTGSFTPGDLCLFGSDLPHIFRADDTTHGAVSYVVQFRLEIFEELLGLPEMVRIQEVLERARHGLRFSAEASEALREDLQELTAARHEGNTVLQLLKILDQLALDASAAALASPGYTHQSTDLGNRRVARVWEMILEREGAEPTQAQVADELGMSISAFSRMFRRATGSTYSETLTELRLGRACRMMTSRNCTIAEAGYHAGYNNLSIFNRHFKKRYGMTPREWRASLGSAVLGNDL